MARCSNKHWAVNGYSAEMSYVPYICESIDDLPSATGWLQQQACPVIAVGEGICQNADVIVSSEKAAKTLISNIEKLPIAAMTFVQVLRCVDHLPVQSAMTVESLAYATLQGGSEFRTWLDSREEPPVPIEGGDGPPIEIERQGNRITARLNRPQHRNALSVEMRDGLIELFEVVLLDSSVERLELSANGPCFSVGGELREFGLFHNTGQAHWVRSVQNPSRLLARVADRVVCHVHSACMGSGMELPAFAGRVIAEPKTFFQLPELKLGLIPGAGGCVSISRRIGRQRTAWLGLSCKKINAATALEWGLVDELVS